MASFEPQDRNYSAWKFTNGDVDIDGFDPIRDKMLVGDTICANAIEYTSRYRSMQSIPGILLFNGNTYGRRGERVLYKCVPNNRQLPSFLIPYTQKGTTFNKSKINKFVLFKFVEWSGKHPIGMITNTLGDVSDLSVFYSYQLFCKEIHIPIQRFTKATNVAIRKWDVELKSQESNGISGMEDRTQIECITIDPVGSIDFDDAISITKHSDGGCVLSVYISNVAARLNELNLWEHLTERVATIYLPDSKRSMLPPSLSDNLCSLLEGEKRYAVAMDVTLSPEHKVVSVDFVNCVIRVAKNYVYEESALLSNDSYQDICKVVKSLSLHIRYVEEINDSHDVVALCMIMMNHRVGTILKSVGCGIFRGVSILNEQKRQDVPSDIKQIVALWRNTKGDYETFDKHQGHDLIGGGLDAYAQVTSPIRRIVDLINIIELQVINGSIEKSCSMIEFVNRWMERIQYINNTMKSISKVQNDCKLIERCMTCKKESYVGYCIESNNTEQVSSKFKWKHIIHVPKLALTTSVIINDDLMLYGEYKVTLHLFVDESTLKQKVRLQILH
tara:strand:- start:389 stop:2062 length:1674 start_codon:yes stop_codon:yes gene_type:complete